MLASELWDLVIDQLSGDKESLGSMGRVCKAFIPRTRRHLFHAVDFSLDESDLDTEVFHAVAPYISEVKMTDGCPDILSYELPRLKLIHFDHYWFDHESPRALQIYIPNLSSITTLHFSNVRLETARLFFNSVGSFSNLSSLMLDLVVCTELHESSRNRHPPSGLSALNLRSSIWNKQDMASAVTIWLKDSEVEIQKLAVHLSSCGPPVLRALGSFFLTKGHTLDCLTFDIGGCTAEEDWVTDEDGVSIDISQFLFPDAADTRHWTSLSSITFEGIVIGDSVHATSHMNECLIPLLHHLLRAGSDVPTRILTLEIRLAGLYEVGSPWSDELDWVNLSALLKESRWRLKLVLSCDEEEELEEEEIVARWRHRKGSYLLYVLDGIDCTPVEWHS